MGSSLKLASCLLFLGCGVGSVVIASGDLLPAPPVASNEGKDKFGHISSNINASETDQMVETFLNYACEIMVVITNEAQGPIRLRCASKTSVAREHVVRLNNSMVFTLKPHVDGTTDFWCNLGYRQVWSRFDVYTEDQPYICPGKKRLYRYSVRHDGLYADPEINGGNKISALFKGHNHYILWEDYDELTGQADGLLVNGYVDGGMCAELPDHLNNRASVVTVCDHRCLLAYDLPRCKGPYEKLQAGDGCQDFRMDSTLRHKISALKGC